MRRYRYWHICPVHGVEDLRQNGFDGADAIHTGRPIGAVA